MSQPAGVWAESAPTLQPVGEGQRIPGLDVLRGVAVLGILWMNIVAFGLPFPAYQNPLAAGGFQGWDRSAWWISHLLFELKFMTIFSALFGAGLVLMRRRAKTAARPYLGVLLRRYAWLAVIGALHGYLLWFGDILFSYAIAGFVLLLFRDKSAKTLVISGSIAVLIPLAMGVMFGRSLLELKSRSSIVQEKIAAGGTATQQEADVLEEWADMRRRGLPTAEELSNEFRAHRGGYWGILEFRAPITLEFQSTALLGFVLWRSVGVMLLGMAAMKIGVFSAALPLRTYLLMAVAGYGVGLPITAWGAQRLIAHDFGLLFSFSSGMWPNYFASLLVAMGHVAVVMIWCRAGGLAVLKRSLAAVGRMAFSNYLMQTVICTTFFYGYGFGWYGYFSRGELLIAAVAVWLIQLIASPIWLRFFRFGPAEWVWRSLTYWKAQPMIRRLPPSDPSAMAPA